MKLRIRNINRWYNYNRAAVRFNKRYDKLNYRQLLVLFTIARIPGSSGMVVTEYLRKYNHTMSPNQLTEAIKELKGLGYITYERFQLNLTVTGVNTVNTMDDLIRNIRIDR